MSASPPPVQIQSMLRKAKSASQAQNLPQARHWLEKAVQKAPRYFPAQHLLANLCLAQKDYAEAARLFAYLLEHLPSKSPLSAEFYGKLGKALTGLHNLEEASKSYWQSLKIQRQQPETWQALARIEERRGRRGAALDAWLEVLKLKGPSASLHHRIGLLFLALREYKRAEAQFQSALQVQADFAPSLYQLAAFYERQGPLEKAREALSALIELQPENALWQFQLETLQPTIPQSAQEITEARQRLKTTLQHYTETGLNCSPSDLNQYTCFNYFILTYQGEHPNRQLREAFVSLFRPLLPRWEPPPPRPETERAEIAFLVTAGHENIFARSVCPLLNRFDTSRFNYTIFAPQEGFDKEIAPQLTRDDIRHIVLPGELKRAAETVFAAHCDILNFWEIGTDNVNFFLPFYRLAPIQTLSWGWPLTSGNPEVDYFLSSVGMEPPGSEAEYTEKLHRFSVLPAYFERPKDPEPQERQDFGFSAQDHLYFCAQTLLKIHPDFDVVVREILRRDPQAQVIFLKFREPQIAASLATRLRAACGENAARLHFLKRLPYEQYLSLLRVSDLVLDSFYYSGANTSCEALAMGTPVVCWPSDQQRGRFTASVYELMGLPELISESPEAYLEMALKLGTQATVRQELSAKILKRCEHFFGDQTIVHEYETFFAQALTEARHKASSPKG